MRDYRRCSSYEHEQVAGAYVGMIEWDGGRFGYFWIEKVWPEARLEVELQLLVQPPK